MSVNLLSVGIQTLVIGRTRYTLIKHFRMTSLEVTIISLILNELAKIQHNFTHLICLDHIIQWK